VVSRGTQRINEQSEKVGAVSAHRPAGYPDLPSIDINLQFTARENRAANRLRLWTNIGNEPDGEDYPDYPYPMRLDQPDYQTL